MSGRAATERVRTVGTTEPGDTSFTDILGLLARRNDLSRQQAAFALHRIVEGSAGEAEAAAFLMGLRSKGETEDEIAGLADVMRELVVPVKTAQPRTLLDIVGTGGDGLGTFNISTTAALVVAAVGVKVAKHGNRAASSRCGSADVLEALEVHTDLGPEEVADCIETVGIGFMFAPLFHSSMMRVGQVRKSLGIRTVFNFLGPLTNPAGAGHMLVGVGAEDYLEVLAGALARTGCERALLVRGQDGMDELSVTGPSAAIEVRDGRVAERMVVDPRDHGLSLHPLSALAGGDAVENAGICRSVLAGSEGAPRDAVLLNAGAALYVAGSAPSIAEGVSSARRAIDNGDASRVLDALVAHTRLLRESRT